MSQALAIALLFWLATCVSAQQPFQLDPSFRTDISHINVRGVLPLDDGRIIISGQLQFPGDPNIRSGARLFSDGSRDMTFPPVANMGGRLQRWGDKYYCGNGDIVRRHLISGGIDPSFIMMNNDPLFSSLQGADYHVYPDGRLVITGVHNLNDPARGFVGYYSLIWFDATGHVDTTKHHRWSNGSTGAIAQLPDGKFMLNCVCTQYEGRPTSRAMRIHPDGALDTTFFAGINSGAVHAFHGLPDGRVYVGGHFTIAGQPGGWRHLVRLLPDGSLDPAFNNNLQFGLGALTGIGAAVVSITPMGSDRLLLCGGFQSVSGQPRYGICMIDTTGQLTDDFSEAGCGTYQYQGFTYGSPDAITFDGQGHVYLFGAFHGYSDGTQSDPLQRQVVRLFAPDITTSMPVASARAPELVLSPNPASAWVAVDHRFAQAPAQAAIRVRDVLGKPLLTRAVSGVQGQTVLPLAGLQPGAYTVELLNQGVTLVVQRLIVQ